MRPLIVDSKDAIHTVKNAQHGLELTLILVVRKNCPHCIKVMDLLEKGCMSSASDREFKVVVVNVSEEVLFEETCRLFTCVTYPTFALISKSMFLLFRDSCYFKCLREILSLTQQVSSRCPR